MSVNVQCVENRDKTRWLGGPIGHFYPRPCQTRTSLCYRLILGQVEPTRAPSYEVGSGCDEALWSRLALQEAVIVNQCEKRCRFHALKALRPKSASESFSNVVARRIGGSHDCHSYMLSEDLVKTL
jgi:hypothetical protein